MTFGSLFAGIGGFDLGLERAGMVCKWQVEIDPFCRAVLEKHWPDVRRYEDVREAVGYRRDLHGYIDAHAASYCLEPVDLICGGFPCQDISVAGDGAGIDGERSGLWSEYDRIIGELQPRYVLVENVSALLARGLGRVLGDLAARGYDAEWDCIPAAAFGAPHQRDRVWIVAYASCDGLERAIQASDGECSRARIFQGCAIAGASVESGAEQWRVEPAVGRVAHGIPSRVDRLRGLGNAVVPQIAEWLGRRILEADAAMSGDSA